MQMRVVFGHAKAGEQVGKEVVEHEPWGLLRDVQGLRGFDLVAEREACAGHDVQGGDVVGPEVEEDGVGVVLDIEMLAARTVRA